MKYLVKFVSVDGLVRFENSASEDRPERYLRRAGAYALRYEDYARPGCDFPPAVVRCYESYDGYLDPETGQYIFEYRERP